MAKEKTLAQVELTVRTDMKSAVKFEATPEVIATGVPVTNVYIRKTAPGINEAKSVRVTVEAV